MNFCGNVIFFAIQENLLASEGVAEINHCLGFGVTEKDIFPLKTANPECELKVAQTRLIVWIEKHDSETSQGACGLKSARLAAALETFKVSSKS